MSSPWLMTYASCSGNSRMFSVCSTAPIDGIARYASMCSCEFHMNVPTRSPVLHAEPRERVARAGPRWRRRRRSVARRGPDSVQVTHSRRRRRVCPCRRIAVIVSGKSCIVLEITSPPRSRVFVAKRNARDSPTEDRADRPGRARTARPPGGSRGTTSPRTTAATPGSASATRRASGCEYAVERAAQHRERQQRPAPTRPGRTRAMTSATIDT